jgi:hydrogenase nickel incorporation protein HypA/HybF
MAIGREAVLRNHKHVPRKIMHETGLTRDLVRKIEAISREADAKRVVSVTVRLGALAHMSPSHFREHFDESAAGTIAEGAEMRIIESGDIHDPDAQHVVLEDVQIEVDG